jgi:hypothetical protein
MGAVGLSRTVQTHLRTGIRSALQKAVGVKEKLAFAPARTLRKSQATAEIFAVVAMERKAATSWPKRMS